jgi:hypothetical protein
MANDPLPIWNLCIQQNAEEKVNPLPRRAPAHFRIIYIINFAARNNRESALSALAPVASRHTKVYDSSMQFPRVVRLDDSDSRVYENPAVPGEWAVPGSFVFLDVDLDSLSGKPLQAFRHGFLGTGSFGWSTLVMVESISDEEYQSVIEVLVNRFMQQSAAPGREAALAMAQEEVEFAASICHHEIHTLLAIERNAEDGSIVENFRIVRRSNAIDHSTVLLWTAEDDPV